MKHVGHGKVILLGEHAVVYGFPALAAALDCGVTIHARPGVFGVEIPQWKICVDASADHPVAAALRAIADYLGIGRPALRMMGDAELPSGAGLGSSAAMSVAIARALAATHQLVLNDERLRAAATAAEQQFHHRPSGVDVALASAGGVGVFRRAIGLSPIAVPPFALVIGDSGEPRSTATMVQRVASATDGDARDVRLIAIGNFADIGIDAITRSDIELLGTAFNDAQRVLAELGVSTPRIDELCALALHAGAWGAKLTGAGGGGAVIAVSRDPQAIVAAWQAAGVHAWIATIGGASGSAT